MLGIDHQVFDASHLATWPYYTRPTFYVAKGAPALVRDLARALSESSSKSDYGIYQEDLIARTVPR